MKTLMIRDISPWCYAGSCQSIAAGVEGILSHFADAGETRVAREKLGREKLGSRLTFNICAVAGSVNGSAFAEATGGQVNRYIVKVREVRRGKLQ